MNDKLLEQIKQLKNAIARFSEVLELPETDVNRDATIQRFEFTFELAWKTIKAIAIKDGLEVVSPADTIRVGNQMRLIDNVEAWLNFLDVRNTTSHVYDELMAKDAYLKIKPFLPFAKSLLESINKRFPN